LICARLPRDTLTGVSEAAATARRVEAITASLGADRAFKTALPTKAWATAWKPPSEGSSATPADCMK
jgi:hypothetical protein